MNDIMHAVGYLSGAAGIGFALALGMYVGIKCASWLLGPFQINVGPVNMDIRITGEKT